jgi:hypothetical protein
MDFLPNQRFSQSEAAQKTSHLGRRHARKRSSGEGRRDFALSRFRAFELSSFRAIVISLFRYFVIYLSGAVAQLMNCFDTVVDNGNEQNRKYFSIFV